MGSQENGNRVLFSSSAMDTALVPDIVAEILPICSEPIFKSQTCLDPFWDPTVLGIQGEKFGNSCMVLGNQFSNSHYPAILENRATGSGSSPHFPSNPSNPGLLQIMPKISIFGSESFSDIISSYSINESPSPSNFQGGNWQCQNSPNGKRKRKNVEVEQQQKGLSANASDSPKEDGEKKTIGRQAAKQIKDSNSIGAAESSKENYIHVRAKRGQATNSHSLAERVRREKISERMKLLQELVPGCNKITGKAVMLDEIINYVQSLQQQVEFLSMKLASVNPELNMDIENMLSKDSQGGNLGVGLGLSSSCSFRSGHPLGNIRRMASPCHPLPQNLWSNELQSILQMGYESNLSSVNSFGTHGKKCFPGLSKMVPE